VSAVRGKVCVVTGAASGIGRALAAELAHRGARGIALADVDENGLAETARALGDVEVHTARLDVADRAAVAAFARDVVARFHVVHQLYNNAGVADGGLVEEFGYERYERVLGINLWGVIHGTKELLPHLIASGDGHVVNVSSLNGIMAQPGLSAYCASKFAVRGFTESLAIELAAAGAPVKVTVVHPGGVKTNIARAALAHAERSGRPVTDEDRARERLYSEKLLRMPASKAARIIVDGVEAGRPRVLVGADAKALDLLVRALPARWPAVAGAALRRLERHPRLTPTASAVSHRNPGSETLGA
jgi:NAD(P)-dependent dehydrogenase (short-subunit alcohol dehydrogenase family)